MKFGLKWWYFDGLLSIYDMNNLKLIGLWLRPQDAFHHELWHGMNRLGSVALEQPFRRESNGTDKLMTPRIQWNYVRSWIGWNLWNFMEICTRYMQCWKCERRNGRDSASKIVINGFCLVSNMGQTNCLKVHCTQQRSITIFSLWVIVSTCSSHHLLYV